MSEPDTVWGCADIPAPVEVVDVLQSRPAS